MTLLSLLHNSLRLVAIDKPYLRAPTITTASVALTPEHAEQFDVDVWAAYLKKLFEQANKTIKGKQGVQLILGQRFFTFIRIDVPVETPPSGVDEYIRHHLFESMSNMRTQDAYVYELVTNRGTMYANVYILPYNTAQQIQTLLGLFDLHVERIYPEAPLIFNAFSHTLNKNKKEPVLFLEYGTSQSVGLMFDAEGLYSGTVQVLDSHHIVPELKKIVASDPKPSRLIVSGKLSTEIRQDSFTKEVGMWTNPLHRILQGSAAEKKAAELALQGEDSLLYLREVIWLCAADEKQQLLSLAPGETTAPPPSPPHPAQRGKRWIIITAVIATSAGITLGLGWGIGKMNYHLSISSLFPSPTPAATPTPEPSPTPTPPPIAREDISITIENGIGTTGLASTYSQRLKGKGYSIEGTDNADNYDYKTTVIQTGSKAIYTMLVADLKTYVSGTPTFKKTDATDSAVIILGADSE